MRILSVSLSVKCMHCDKTEEKSVQFVYHAKDHLVYRSFLRRRMVCGGRPPSTWNLGSTGPPILNQ